MSTTTASPDTSAGATLAPAHSAGTHDNLGMLAAALRPRERDALAAAVLESTIRLSLQSATAAVEARQAAQAEDPPTRPRIALRRFQAASPKATLYDRQPRPTTAALSGSPRGVRSRTGFCPCRGREIEQNQMRSFYAGFRGNRGAGRRGRTPAPECQIMSNLRAPFLAPVRHSRRPRARAGVACKTGTRTRSYRKRFQHFSTTGKSKVQTQH
jgi:hypothetical protein